ncbi:MAG: metallophosphoesterase family protein [Chthonomonadales bacterium]
MRFLCIGDVHIGRSSSRVPPGSDAPTGAADAWLRAVDAAIECDADAVLVAGDLVDDNSGYFAALGPVKQGMELLAKHGIPVYAIAGNHDFRVLPKMAPALAPLGFHLLGIEGVWECASVATSDGQDQVRLWGWSFPGPSWKQSPIAGFPKEEIGAARLPVLAMVHGEITSGPSYYAPLFLEAMRRCNADLWLVGHVHKPADYRSEGFSVINLGSLQALDPGEAGVRGAWLVDVTASGIEARQIPVSSVGYLEATLDAGGIRDEADLTTAFEQLFECSVFPNDYELLRVYRVRVGGRSSRLEDLRKMCERIQTDQPWLRDRRIVVDQVVFEALPELDLQELAGRHDAPGVLARMILACEAGRLDQEYPDLMRNAEQARSRLLRKADVGNDTLLPPMPQIVREECVRLLEALLTGRQGHNA